MHGAVYCAQIKYCLNQRRFEQYFSVTSDGEFSPCVTCLDCCNISLFGCIGSFYIERLEKHGANASVQNAVLFGYSFAIFYITSV